MNKTLLLKYTILNLALTIYIIKLSYAATKNFLKNGYSVKVVRRKLSKKGLSNLNAKIGEVPGDAFRKLKTESNESLGITGSEFFNVSDHFTISGNNTNEENVISSENNMVSETNNPETYKERQNSTKSLENEFIDGLINVLSTKNNKPKKNAYTKPTTTTTTISTSSISSNSTNLTRKVTDPESPNYPKTSTNPSTRNVRRVKDKPGEASTESGNKIKEQELSEKEIEPRRETPRDFAQNKEDFNQIFDVIQDKEWNTYNGDYYIIEFFEQNSTAPIVRLINLSVGLYNKNANAREAMQLISAIFSNRNLGDPDEEESNEEYNSNFGNGFFNLDEIINWDDLDFMDEMPGLFRKLNNIIWF
ncbi:hypothetical protein HWI79_605 [Cryptosporidium felis]|nr:hypothetical protein HWI79_605 [Cryptosporidium felis]